ncbi:unnamed protein product [Lupinus luteus]|uniref:Pentatricopeptide repeat-containing protein n=1 Tax=Lupinus luteus TaxID=3873 RepID=A0AAV1W7P4_LUPLU
MAMVTIVKMGKRGYILDEVTFGTLMIGYFKNDKAEKGLKLWDEMKERDDAVDKLNELLEKGLISDEATYNIIIHGYCWEGAVEKAFQFHNKTVENSFKLDIFTCNILLQGLCEEGMLEKALNFFNTWVSKGKPVDVVTYNTLISALCKEGRVQDAFDLMNEMEVKILRPDKYTYNAIISALTHAGRTVEAEKLMSKFVETGQDLKTHDTAQGDGSVLEEEIVRLEEHMVHFRQDLYQKAVYISSSKMKLNNASPYNSPKLGKIKLLSQTMGKAATSATWPTTNFRVSDWPSSHQFQVKLFHNGAAIS